MNCVRQGGSEYLEEEQGGGKEEAREGRREEVKGKKEKVAIHTAA